MSLVGSNVSSVIFSFLFTTERRHPKKITIGDFFKPGFSRKVRIQLFLKFFTANRKHSRCLKDYRDKKKRILFYTGGRKNLVFFPIMPRKVLDRVVDSDGFRYFSYKILTINTTYSSKGQWTWRRYNEYRPPLSHHEQWRIRRWPRTSFFSKHRKLKLFFSEYPCENLLTNISITGDDEIRKNTFFNTSAVRRRLVLCV